MGTKSRSFKRNIMGSRERCESDYGRPCCEMPVQVSHSMLHKYLDVAGVMLIVINDKQRVTLANKKACDVLGYTEEEIFCKNWFDLCIPKRMRKDVKDVFNKLMLGEMEAVEYYENPIVTKSGEERLVKWHNALLRDDSGRPIATMSSGEDITDARIAEEKLKRYSDRLEELVEERTRELDQTRSKLFQSAKLSAVGRMAAGLAHQLNSPIFGSLLAVDALLADFKNSDRQAHLLDVTRKALTGMQDIINSILSHAKIMWQGNLTIEYVDVNKTLDLILSMVELECRRSKVTIIRDFQKGLPLMRVGVGEIDQVFLNIINNAIDAMPKGGTLQVRTERAKGGVSVKIIDTGCGIDGNVIGHIFEPFFTTRMAEKGVGLGLSLAQEFVHKYGGEITVSSEVGKGSEFDVYLPVHKHVSEGRRSKSTGKARRLKKKARK